MLRIVYWLILCCVALFACTMPRGTLRTIIMVIEFIGIIAGILTEEN